MPSTTCIVLEGVSPGQIDEDVLGTIFDAVEEQNIELQGISIIRNE